MGKYLFCFFILLGQAGVSMAQSAQDTLFVVPGKESLYFYHVVDKGESLYGVARNFYLDPKVLAKANNMSLNTPLKLYQLLKVPLDSNNLVQSAGVNVSGLTPLYHKVIKGETLYRIGEMHDKVNAELLKKWNHITGNEVKTGQYLIVGWLKAANAGTNPALASGKSAETQPSTQDGATVATGNPVPPSENEGEKPAEKTDVATASPAAIGGVTNTSTGGHFLNEVIAAENRSRTTSSKQPTVTATAAKPSAAPSVTVTTKDDDDDAFAINNPPAPAKKTEEVLPPKVQKEDKTETVAVEKPAPKKEEKKDTVVKEDNAFAKMLNEVTHKPQAQTASTAPAPANTQATSASIETSEAEPSAAENTAVVPVQKDVVPTATNEAAPPVENHAAATPDPNAELAPAVSPMDSAAMTTTAKSEFEQQFIQQTDNETKLDAKKGAAGWFRSNVKPGSGRYYALCNELPRGTIVKVINPISGKYVLAKVLDAIPRQKENYNLIVKLSDAAMEDLGVFQSRFWCEIQYAKGGAK